MSTVPEVDPAPVAAAEPATGAASVARDPAPERVMPASHWAVPRGVATFFLAFAALGAVGSGMLWQKLSAIQEQLARQSADSGAQAVEARALARQAQDLTRDTAARLSVAEARISEATLQRAQLEELMKSLSRSRDENLVVDIESAIQLAQQQSQLTGSVEPLLAALRSADQRVARAAQPRLAPLQRAIARDVDRIKAATVADTPGLLVKLDELVRVADELPMANAVAVAAPAAGRKSIAAAPMVEWWERALAIVADEARRLVRVSRVEHPEATLLSPEQSFFLRENLKLKLLNARLGLLARQTEAARADIGSAAQTMSHYFDTSSRKTQAALQLAQQVQAQMRNLELPRVDGTMAALATAAAGR